MPSVQVNHALLFFRGERLQGRDGEGETKRGRREALKPPGKPPNTPPHAPRRALTTARHGTRRRLPAPKTPTNRGRKEDRKGDKRRGTRGARKGRKGEEEERTKERGRKPHSKTNPNPPAGNRKGRPNHKPSRPTNHATTGTPRNTTPQGTRHPSLHPQPGSSGSHPNRNPYHHANLAHPARNAPERHAPQHDPTGDTPPKTAPPNRQLREPTKPHPRPPRKPGPPGQNAPDRRAPQHNPLGTRPPPKTAKTNDRTAPPQRPHRGVHPTPH